MRTCWSWATRLMTATSWCWATQLKLHPLPPPPEEHAQIAAFDPETSETPAPAPRRRWLSEPSEAPAEPRAKPTREGTLFERMSSMARGSAKLEDDGSTDADPLDIPRFLNRQSNQ